MTDELLDKQLRELTYPVAVDVTDAVMDQIRRTPLLVPQHRKFSWRKVSVGVAACVALAIGINFATLYTRTFDVAQIGITLAEVYDYHADYGYESTSDYGLGFVESLYDDPQSL